MIQINYRQSRYPGRIKSKLRPILFCGDVFSLRYRNHSWQPRTYKYKTSRWWQILVPSCIIQFKLHEIWPVDSHLKWSAYVKMGFHWVPDWR